MPFGMFSQIKHVDNTDTPAESAGTKKAVERIPLRSRLSTKVVVGVVLISILSLMVVNISLLPVVERLFKEVIGQRSVVEAQAALGEIGNSLLHKVDSLSAFVHGSMLVDETMSQSLEQYKSVEDKSQYIAAEDAVWQATPTGSTTPLMANIMNNNLSIELRRIATYFEVTYGHEVFPEIFLTNQYGVNIAQTGRTSDYYQADEIWWQQAATEGLYIGEIDYDDSAGVTALETAVAIFDQAGGFMGVMKVLIAIQEIETIVDDILPHHQEAVAAFHQAHGHDSHQTLSLTLLDSHNNLIHTSEPQSDYKLTFDSDHHVHEEHELLTDGYFYTHDQTGREVLVAHVHTESLEGLGKLHWTLLLENDVSELYQPAEQATRTFQLLMILIIILIGLLLTLFFLRFVVLPIAVFSNTASKVAGGDLTARVNINTTGELQQFANRFNDMTKKLQDAKENLEEKVNLRTKELINTQADLENKIADLERFQKLTTDRELKMMALKKELKELRDNQNQE